MNTFFKVLALGKSRLRGFLLVALLVSLGTSAVLIEPFIYRAIIDDVAGVFVEPTSLKKVEGFVTSVGRSVVHIEEIGSKVFHSPLKKVNPEEYRRKLRPRTVNQAFATVLLGALFILVLRIISEGVKIIGDNKSARLSNDIERSFILDTFKHVLRLPVSFFSSRPSGTVAHQMDQSDQISPIFTAASQEIWPQAFILVSVFAILFSVNGQLAMVVLLVVPVYVLVTWRMSKRLDTALDDYYVLWDSVSGRIQQSVAGIKTIQTHGTMDFEAKRLEKSANLAYETYLKRNRMQNIYNYMQELLMTVSKAGVLAIGGLKALQHQLTPGDVVLFLAYVDRVFEPINGLTTLLMTLQQHTGSVRRAQRLLANPVMWGEDKPAFKPGKGEVQFENVEFSYSPRSRLVLDGISFHIKPGEHVALIGPSGAGKTTISDLLAALFPVNSGDIIIDGQSLNDISPSSLRKWVRSVATDGMLFNDTIAANIKYGCLEATPEEIETAALEAGLEPVLKRLPARLKTMVGERGVELSMGERQRILLARAFLARPSVLILDEATSNLDFKTEEHIKVALEKLSKGRTSILIAHRKSMLTDVDRVLVIRNGKIEQDGTPDELIKRQGYFRDMMQSSEKSGE